MQSRNTQQAERGVVLVMVLICLTLLCTIGVLMMLNAGVESILNGNYRSSTRAFYASLSGLEEARGRLSVQDPNSISTWVSSAGTPVNVGQVLYITNPLAGQTVDPTDQSATNPYADNEYDTEFGASSLAAANAAGNVQKTPSVSPVAGLDGPLYKWVRITPVTEKSLNIDIEGDGSIDGSTPLFFGSSTSSAAPTLNATSAGRQAFELTALSVLPDRSRKMLQYVVAPPLNLSFQAALTLDGNGVIFNTTTSQNFWVKGNDQYGPPGCTPGSSVVTALGYTYSGDAGIVNQILHGPPPSPDRTGNYTNYVAPNPDVSQVTLAPNLTTVAGLNSLVQTITENADVPPITPSGPLSDSNNFMPAAMSATNPMTIVVNGDLTINNWHQHGYGLLLVTGKLTYDPDAFWHGIVLVIGKGWLYAYQNSGTGGHFEGAVFIAQTQDSSGIPLSSVGASRFDFLSSSLTPAGGNYAGVYYSSCWIQAALRATRYKVLSFREIPQ